MHNLTPECHDIEHAITSQHKKAPSAVFLHKIEHRFSIHSKGPISACLILGLAFEVLNEVYFVLGNASSKTAHTPHTMFNSSVECLFMTCLLRDQS